MATALENRDGKRTGIIIIILLIVVVLVIAFILGGTQGIFGVIKVFIGIMLFVGFIGLIVYVIYFLFIKKFPRNLPFENWKEYKESCLDNGSDMMEDLVLTGDKKHSAKSFFKIKGYLRVLGFNGKPYDMFCGKKSPNNPFEEYKIVMLEPDQHSDLIGDVYIDGISLVKKYGFYFLNTNMMDWEAIDKTIAMDTYRTLMYETLGDLKSIVDRAVGISPDEIRARNADKLMKIPQLQGQQPPPNQGGQ